MEVDGFQGAVAKTNPNGGASDTHGSRNRERVLREEQHSDGRSHFHGASYETRLICEQLEKEHLQEKHGLGIEHRERHHGENEPLLGE